MRKMNYVRRLSSWIAVVIIASIMLVGCNGDSDKNLNSTTSNTEEYNEVEPFTNDEIVDMKGYEFTIVSPFIHNDTTNKTLTVAEQQFEKRRREVEKLYNCNITILKEHTHTANIAAKILAGNKLGDLVQFDLTNLFQSIGSGYLRPLNTIEGIDVNDERWEKGYTKLAHYDDTPYGLYFWQPVEVRAMVLYNKTLLKEYGIKDDPYQLVKEKKWTFDKFRELAIACTRDTDGDGIPNTYGITTSTPEKLGTDFMHANGAAIAKQEDGTVKETFGEQSAVKAMNYLSDLINVDKVFYTPTQWLSQSTYYAGGLTTNDIFRQFTNNKVGFCVTEAWVANQVVLPTASNIEYGIVPLPMGPDVTEYITPAHYALVFAITKNNTDIEKVVPIINALGLPPKGYEGSDWVDDAIEMDFCQDGDIKSVEMYKLCYETAYYDIGLSVKSIYQDFSKYCVMMPIFWGVGTPTSQLDSFRGTAKTALDNLFNK